MSLSKHFLVLFSEQQLLILKTNRAYTWKAIYFKDGFFVAGLAAVDANAINRKVKYPI